VEDLTSPRDKEVEMGDDTGNDRAQAMKRAIAAQMAAERERRLAADEAELSALERRTSGAVEAGWQRTAHRLASEAHAENAASHQRTATRFELAAEAARRGR
jgi:hypothetical protein